MVFNLITHNMESSMKAIRYSDATKKNAMSLLSKGMTIAQVARKHNTTVQTVHYWKKQFPELVKKTVVTSLSTNGVAPVKATKPKKKLNAVTITLPVKVYEELAKQAKEDIRTLDSQAKFYILNGIRNHHGIPF
jgi:transposase-like protein